MHVAVPSCERIHGQVADVSMLVLRNVENMPDHERIPVMLLLAESNLKQLLSFEKMVRVLRRHIDGYPDFQRELHVNRDSACVNSEMLADDQ